MRNEWREKRFHPSKNSKYASIPRTEKDSYLRHPDDLSESKKAGYQPMPMLETSEVIAEKRNLRTRETTEKNREDHRNLPPSPPFPSLQNMHHYALLIFGDQLCLSSNAEEATHPKKTGRNRGPTSTPLSSLVGLAPSPPPISPSCL